MDEDQWIEDSARARLALARLGSDHRLSQLATGEREAFLMGYALGMEEAVLYMSIVLAGLILALVCALPMTYVPIRNVMRPWAEGHVKSGHSLVMWVQKWRHPILDTIHSFTAASCSVEFYITILPLTYWLAVLMSFAIYVGNMFKDVICSPRPDWGSGIRLKNIDTPAHSEAGLTDHHEYGLPSTHTINTVCLLCYLYHFDNFHGAGSAEWLFQTWGHFHFQLVTALMVAWAVLVVHGRLYLGMHSPIDIVGGFIVAVLILAFYIPLEDFVDAWLLYGKYKWVYQPVMAVAQLFAYPTPQRPTPSYNYVVYFTGVVLGIVLAFDFSPHFIDVPHCTAVKTARGAFFSLQSLGYLIRRFVVGIPIIVVARLIAKKVFTALVLGTFRVLRIRASDHDAFYQHSESGKDHNTPPGFNQNTPIRLLTYTVVGLAAVECSWAFDYLGI